MRIDYIKTKVNGEWKSAKINYIKVNGTWKQVTTIWTKISGNWVSFQNLNKSNI